MQAFTTHRGIAAPLQRDNIDTDAIIPSREMKLVSKQGLAEGLFAGWRYLASNSRDPNPEFVLNDPKYCGASILLAGSNFGCGSSREHAVWALQEFGIRAIIAVSFGSIFYNNCVRNGILPVQLPGPVCQQLQQWVSAAAEPWLTVDLQQCTISTSAGFAQSFALAAADRRRLLLGLDSIAETLQQQPAIEQFEQRDRQRRPWIYQLPAVDAG